MARLLTEQESVLIKTLVTGTSGEVEIIRQLPSYLVEDINEEKMKGLLFLDKTKEVRAFGRILVEGVFRDEDNVSVSATINLDQEEDLYQLDIWKANSTVLKKYPLPEAITIYKEQVGRTLSDNECTLIKALISGMSRETEIIRNLPFYVVQTMDDGGMGSALFLGKSKFRRRLGGILVEGEFLDSDDIPAGVAINLDQDGDLYELDMWKYDYSTLKRYPQPEDIEIFRED